MSAPRLYRTGHRCPTCQQVHMYSDLSKDALLARHLPCASDWYQPDGSPIVVNARKETRCQACGAGWVPRSVQLEEQS